MSKISRSMGSASQMIPKYKSALDKMTILPHKAAKTMVQEE